MSISTLIVKKLFNSRKLVQPRLETANVRPEDASVISKIGLPKEFAGWYRAPTIIGHTEGRAGLTYSVYGNTRTIKNACSINAAERFDVVIDGYNGTVIFVQLWHGGVVEVLNSSLLQMLYCMGKFLNSSKNDWSDVEQSFADCREADPTAFTNPESVWNEMFQNAISGMF